VPVKRFPPDALSAIDEAQVIGVRAGAAPHRFLAVWAVVVERRVFVRSWGLKERSWYTTFLEEPWGAITVGGRELPVRAVRTRSERLKEAVDRAYAAKYRTPWARKIARGFRLRRRRDTTTELAPR
jgi:hypothetical protein